MSEWKSFKLSELGQIIGGSTPSTRNSMNYEGGHISWITPKDLSNHSRRFIAQGARNITEQGLKNCSAQLIPKNSILFSSRAPIGYLAIAEKELCTNQGFKSIVPNDRTNYMFLYYLLKFNKEKIEYISSGTTFKEISGSAMKKFSVCVPPLETQKKIAAVLSALDDKIELNNAINKNLEEQAQAIYKNMFVDNFNPDWKSGTLGEFVEVKRGGSPRPIQDYLSDEGLRWLKISDVTALASPYVIKIKEHIKESGLNKTVFLSSGSLVLSNSATPGIPKILDVDTCIHDGWLYFSDSKFSKYFLYLYFKYVKNQLINLGNGSVFTNLKIEIVKSFPVSLPDEKTLSRFDEIIAPLFESMKNIIRENQKLGELRDALLPRLMSGEIDVSAVEI